MAYYEVTPLFKGGWGSWRDIATQACAGTSEESKERVAELLLGLRVPSEGSYIVSALPWRRCATTSISTIMSRSSDRAPLHPFVFLTFVACLGVHVSDLQLMKGIGVYPEYISMYELKGSDGASYYLRLTRDGALLHVDFVPCGSSEIVPPSMYVSQCHQRVDAKGEIGPGMNVYRVGSDGKYGRYPTPLPSPV